MYSQEDAAKIVAKFQALEMTVEKLKQQVASLEQNRKEQYEWNAKVLECLSSLAVSTKSHGDSIGVLLQGMKVLTGA